MNEKQFEKLNANLEDIWHKLENIEHWIMQLSEYGIFSREVEEAIVAIARAQSKDFDEKCKQWEV